MKQLFKYFFIVSFLVVLAFSCSTERNTLVNRSYHTLNARYNGYFNANELLKEAITDYRTNLKEDYYSILPIAPLPNETEVKSMYSPIDTAIVKCTKVIQKHCMPSNDKPSQKSVEYNTFIDENWLTIGIADYYRRDYDGALKKFNYIKKFFKNDPSIFISELWIAKINIAIGKYTEASFGLNQLDKAYEEEQTRIKEKAEKPEKLEKKTKKEPKTQEDKIAKFPTKILFDLELTKADLSLKKAEKKEAILFLENSLQYAKKQKDKARIHYILGQLYEEQGQNLLAADHFTRVLKYNTNYEMIFNARIKRAFLGNDEKLHKDLLKMMKDPKNAPFKDQIYYALATIELQKGNILLAKEYLTKSGFYSTTNTRQKGMAYEKLGDLSFKERDYVVAQKYYKQCADVIDSLYPNAFVIKNKADKLADLVAAVETAIYEDSVQKVAQLNESERIEYVKFVIKKTKEDEARRKKLEAERLLELQQNQNTTAQSNGNGSKWYFTNTKTRTEGFEEFKKIWGTRENEDNWRRSEKIVMSLTDPADQQQDSSLATLNNADTKKPDSLTVEGLMKNLPLTDSAFAVSVQRSLKAHYDAGLIYKNQLNENQLAVKEFNSVLDKETVSDVKLLSAFQLYKMYENSEPSKSEEYKNYILNHFPNSDYANFLRDPDFYIKKKEMDALSEKAYLATLDRYHRKLYYPVIAKADEVIFNEPKNVFRAKYMLLKAMSVGQTTENKTDIVPILNQLIQDYPKSLEATRAIELLDIIKNGVSKNVIVDNSIKSLYTFDDKVKQWVIVFVGEGESSNAAKIKVSDFNREYYSKNKLSVSSKIYGDDQSIVLIQEFNTDIEASSYVKTFKNTRKYLFELQKAKILVISQENLIKLFETQKLKEYEDFYNEHY